MLGWDRLRARRRHLAPLLAGLLVALIAGLALTVTHHEAGPPLGPRVAVRAALHDRQTVAALKGTHWNHAEVNALDDQLARVSFWSGGQIVAEVAVKANGAVSQVASDHEEPVPYGDWVAYQPALLAGLAIIFLLVTLVAPWRRLRNLDAIAALSLVVSVVLFQHRYISLSLITALPGLAYLMVRCATRGLGAAPPALPATPLVTLLFARASAAQRVRWLRVALAVLAAVFVMVGVSSPYAVDVTYAVMEGATLLVHGLLPYGHMPPGIIHGDTYPILSYALYTPLALLSPVYSLWYSVDAALALAVLAALVAAWAAFRSVIASADTRAPETEESGLRAALAVLAFPAALITTSTGTTDVVLAAMLALALLLWRRPAVGSGILAAAGWFKLAPFALLPMFLAPLRGRRLAIAVAAIAAVSAPMLGLLLALGGLHGVGEMVHAMSYQFTRGSLQSVWGVLGIERLQPVAEACVLGLIAAATVRLALDPGLAGDRCRMAALTAAILIGLQLSADYWAFLYVIWVAPLLCTTLFEAGVPEARALPSVHPVPATGAAAPVAA